MSPSIPPSFYLNTFDNGVTPGHDDAVSCSSLSDSSESDTSDSAYLDPFPRECDANLLLSI